MRTSIKTAVLAATFFVLFGCNDVQREGAVQPISPENAYESMIQNLDSLNPGKGLDYFDDERRNRPMAYGLILSAEANRYRFLRDTTIWQRMEKGGSWLLENPDINENGIFGYGLADPFDAFGDKTKNPSHREYAITTGIAIKGLLDWHELLEDSIYRREIESVVARCFLPYLGNQFESPNGLPLYSLDENDEAFDVYNPAAFLAGQMQRFATITEDDSLRSELTLKAEMVMNELFSDAKVDREGNLRWDYGTHRRLQRPNDLVHACYIIEGIRAYIRYGGEPEEEWERLVHHLNRFYSDDHWYEYLKPELQNEEYEPRLWGLGMLMYSLAKEGDYQTIEESLWPQIEKYHLGEGRFKFKPSDERRMIRQSAHVMLGLSYYLYNEESLEVSNS